jgi:hypothetical protein
MILESLVLMTSYLIVGCGGGGKDAVTVETPENKMRWVEEWENSIIDSQNIKYDISTDDGENKYKKTAESLNKGECLKLGGYIIFDTLNNEEYSTTSFGCCEHYTCRK